MFLHRNKIVTLAGFTVWIDASWPILAALLTWTLTLGVFPTLVPHLSRAAYWWMGVGGAIGLFFSIVLHELSHALVARRYDMPIAGIRLFIFGGVAEYWQFFGLAQRPGNLHAANLLHGNGFLELEMPHCLPQMRIKRAPLGEYGFLDRMLARTSGNHRSLIVARPPCRGCPSILPRHILASRMNAARPPGAADG